MPRMIKLRLNDPGIIRQRLNKFAPSQVVEKTEHYEYFIENKNTYRILMRSGEDTYIILSKMSKDKSFEYAYEKLKDNAELAANELRSKYKYSHSSERKVLEYVLKDIKIKFCTIKGIGSFIEAMSDTLEEQNLVDFMKNFGLGEDDIEKAYYDYMIMRNKKYRPTDNNIKPVS